MIIQIDNDFVSSSNAYNSNVYAFENQIIIPYINLQILKDDLIDGVNENEVLNFSILVFKEVSEFLWSYTDDKNNTRYNKSTFSETKNLTVDYFGGRDFSILSSGCEFKIYFKDLYIYLPKNWDSRKEDWIPINTPNFRQNMNSKEVINFFGLSEVSSEFNEFTGADNSNFLKYIRLDGHNNKEIEKKIETNWFLETLL